MIQFDLPKQKSSIIKVLGVGGGGSNAVNFMFNQNIEGVDFIICNTDSKAIEQSTVPNKIQLGPHLTQGLGAGADPSVGKLATEESLDEIRKILEVNTRMAFITVGMGGGTGTGGAPIIAKICKDLGILTVGIVTTPFGFEGPRRLAQAQEGIKQLKPLVDTLLVISNDKLRVQYGNLKMKEAFAKADNVLATAAKCITDVINSRGHIIVDFADVCTVMKNGGVAILGKAEVEGENRAQRAIEEALNSPLLNDNDITGAKWILLNINSTEGDYECTMDELETINDYLRERTGEHSDVIIGMGYDPTLGQKLGVTLIATGFEGRDPFLQETSKKVEAPIEKKIVMTLLSDEILKNDNHKITSTTQAVVEKIEAPEMGDSYFTLGEESSLYLAEEIIAKEEVLVLEAFIEKDIVQEFVEGITDDIEEKDKMITEDLETDLGAAQLSQEVVLFELAMEETLTPTTFILNKPTNIYANEKEAAEDVFKEESEAALEEVVLEKEKVMEVKKEVMMEETPAMQLVMRDESNPPYIKPVHSASLDMSLDNAEEQRRKVAERIQKLRNLSFNINNGPDSNSEFDAVPAYVRRNLDLFGNTLASVENYYSKYIVEKDEHNQTQISTINTFLDGKKPD